MKITKLLFFFIVFVCNAINAQGTLKLIKDLNPAFWSGVNNSNGYGRLCSVKNLLFVIGDDGKVGEELFKYDDISDQLTLVKDIRPGSFYAKIYQMKAHNDKLFFAADNDTIGLEQWVSDGTSAGTFNLKDILANGDGVSEYNGNSASTPFGFIFKAENTTNGSELWISDGTKAGTKLLKDLKSGPSGSYPSSLFYHAGLNKLYFSASDASSNYEVHETNGTAAGTKLSFLANQANGDETDPSNFYNFNGKLVFTGKTGFDFSNGNYKYELFISDGTQTGTSSIFKMGIRTGNPAISNITSIKDKLYFTSFNDLYVTDGTAAGTLKLSSKLKIDEYNAFAILNDRLIFSATDSLNGDEIFISDGTIAGTKLLKDINPGIKNSYSYFYTPFKSKVYFIATTGNENKQVWETDGTESGTKIAFQLNTNGSSYISELRVHNDKLYVVGGDDNLGTELWSFSPFNTKTVNSNKLTEIQIYPNPVFDRIIMNFEADEFINYDLLDLNGRILKSGIIKNNQLNLNIQDISSGIYFISLTGEKSQIARFVK